MCSVLLAGLFTLHAQLPAPAPPLDVRMSVAPSTFDASDYRANTYGAPDHYCDPTRPLSSAGTGALGNPWNYNQCQSEPVAGDVIGHLPIGVGTPVDLADDPDEAMPSFQPANSGTAASRIVHVTRYPAIALANVETNPNRTEIRTNAARPAITGGGGGPTFGANGRNYVTFDGFYVNMAEAYAGEDSGMITCRNTTGIHFRNFVLKGTLTTMQSNPVMYRPDNCRDTVLSNFRASDFDNDPTGSSHPQDALFSDQYGDANFLIEYFEIANTERGIFFKGSAAGGSVHTWGTIRYGVIRNLQNGIRINDLGTAASQLTTIHHVLIHDYTRSGVHFSRETEDARNILVHHVTVADGLSNDINFGGPLTFERQASAVNVSIRDNLFDYLPGSFGEGVNAGESQLALPMNYNAYYKGGTNVQWSLNGAQLNSLAAWRSASGQEANSRVLGSTPFTNRAGNVFTIIAGHEAMTASSTGGQLGAYESGIVPGPRVN